MSTELKIHPIQSQILRTLLFQPHARFSDLNSSKIPTDQFTFHLKQLVQLNLIEKNKNHGYQLTTKGKEFANRFDTEEFVIERQAKLAVLIGCIKQEKGQKKILIQQRLKQPYYGFYGFLTGKIKWGETIQEAAQRELLEETGLKAHLKLVAMNHRMEFTETKELFEDKYFLVFRGENARGKLLADFEGGKNIWFTKDEIVKLPDLFQGIPEIIDMLNEKSMGFYETSYINKKY